MDIPEEVLEIARRCGDGVKLERATDSYNMYVTTSNASYPTGIPTVIIQRGNKIEVLYGEDALDALYEPDSI